MVDKQTPTNALDNTPIQAVSSEVKIILEESSEKRDRSYFIDQVQKYLEHLADNGFSEEAFVDVKMGGIDQYGIEHKSMVDIALSFFQETATQSSLDRNTDYGMNIILAWGLQQYFMYKDFKSLVEDGIINARRSKDYEEEISKSEEFSREAQKKIMKNLNNPYALRFLIGEMLSRKHYLDVVEISTQLMRISIPTQQKDIEIKNFLRESTLSAVRALLNKSTYGVFYVKNTPPEDPDDVLIPTEDGGNWRY